MTIITSSNTNRAKSNSDTNTGKKARTHSRTQRIKVTTLGKAIKPSLKNNSTQEKQRYDDCLRCKESETSVKMLGEQVERLEQLVSDLAKTAKCESSYRSQKLGSSIIDLSTHSLEDLQKLMIATTNVIYPQKTTNVIGKSSNEQVCKTTQMSVLKSDSPTFHAEPMEDISYDQNNTLSKSAISRLNVKASRQDSGFAESKVETD